MKDTDMIKKRTWTWTVRLAIFRFSSFDGMQQGVWRYSLIAATTYTRARQPHLQRLRKLGGTSREHNRDAHVTRLG